MFLGFHGEILVTSRISPYKAPDPIEAAMPLQAYIVAGGAYTFWNVE